MANAGMVTAPLPVEPVTNASEIAAMTAAVAPLAPDSPSGLAPIPGRRAEDPRAVRARFFAKRVGFVRNTYRFLAFQAARPPLILERSLDGGSEWEPVPLRLDPWGYEVLRSIRPPEGVQADLIRRAVFLDDTEGEFNIVDVTETPLSDGIRPAFLVRAVTACERKRDGWVIRDAPSAKPSDGPKAYLQVPANRVYRHWQPDDEWELVATSSLIGMVDDIDTLWTLCRRLRRESRSRLAMNNLLWTPSSAHAITVDLPNGKKVSVFDRDYAAHAGRAINDLNDDNVASIAPLSINTPGNEEKPEIIEIPAMGADLLAYIQDARMVVASGLPLSTTAIFDAQESKNHWGDWLADEKDLQTIGERLRRVLDSFTITILRPALRVGMARGVWRGGDPEMWRIGYNPDVIRRTLDNSENAKWAYSNALIGDQAVREALRLKETDALDGPAFDLWLARQEAIASIRGKAVAGMGLPGVGAGGMVGLPAAPVSPAGLPAGGPVPNNGQPPSAAQAAAGGPLQVFDDRYLLGPVE